MKFSRLRLLGFKSFCDAAELHLEPGLTGVVGPNGCGKSNLVEALRWVMGESSYKAMRASGMDDVIFSGSGSRPSRNTAEVTLVIDNADRTAPAALNNADVLEVTRRIEREAGSIYRVNGKEVRARDVQLLFADASTGAHSPALVRQGQIGELIAAKPQQRRALLEEAAGISGLHSRRHEAELRLRAAEQNLERVDDVIAQVETQLETLKRQARLATRYRSLSGDIRKAEATLSHLRWVAARVAEKETEAQHGKLISALADATSAERAAARALEQAEDAVRPLRAAEAGAGAALQRLTILAEQAEDEARRAAQRRQDLIERQAQLAADLDREDALVAESERALLAGEEEARTLAAEAEGEARLIGEAKARAEQTQLAVRDAEDKAREALSALAQLRARRAETQRAASDAAQRRARLAAQLVAAEQELTGIVAQLQADAAVEAARAVLSEAQIEAEAAEASTGVAEARAAENRMAVEAGRVQLGELVRQLAKLESESQTLARVLHIGTATLWPPVIDQIQVVPGYETALGAALGEDLEASSDDAAPIHWAAPFEGAADPALPAGAQKLSDFVRGSDRIKRRLDQVGLIAAAADGARLRRFLKPGQRLVTLDGALWRWDGYTAAADAPTPAAERLAQRNRLADLDAEIASQRKEQERASAGLAALVAELDASLADEAAARKAWKSAQARIGEAQAVLDRSQKALLTLTARKSALDEAVLRLRDGVVEAEGEEKQAADALAAAADEGEALDHSRALEHELAALRRQADEARIALAGFEGTARLRATRLGQIEADRAGWQRRRQAAGAQRDTLVARAADLAEQLAGAPEQPENLDARREALAEEIEAAREAHKRTADALEIGQTAHREADKASRAAADALSGAREALGRMEERLKGLMAQRQQIERQIQESLGVPANRTAEVAGIKPQERLPEEKQVEERLDRLKAERERLGGVNLSAEHEAEEVGGKLATMVKDRDDLIEAIAKLRGGIQSLNREGRARLSEAFDKVNAHFTELFTTLFGGGTAELSFVESDDPLEAGLEIIARPPGKKPQTMTLLSGGEQALTALSLIFAVFLTNPAPICVLDEVDAPLDDANVERFCTLLDTMCTRTDTRFLVITHNPITMSRVDRLFGVTMAERGVSQLVSVDLTTAQRVREAG